MTATIARASRPPADPAPPNDFLLRVAAYETKIRQLARLAAKAETQAAQNAELRQACRELKGRLDRTRKAKVRAEAKEEEYKADLTHLKSAHKAQMKEAWDYIEVVQRKADDACAYLQRAVIITCEGKPCATRHCSTCGEDKPIYKFPVRPTGGGDSICYGPQCAECHKTRCANARALVRRMQPVRRTAAIIAARSSALAETIAEGAKELEMAS